MKNVMIPTLDINVVMQAHQALAGDYRRTCHMTLGILPDNNQEMYVILSHFYMLC